MGASRTAANALRARIAAIAVALVMAGAGVAQEQPPVAQPQPESVAPRQEPVAAPQDPAVPVTPRLDKSKLLADLTAILRESPGLDPEDVMLVFKETQWENWAFAGGRQIHV